MNDENRRLTYELSRELYVKNNGRPPTESSDLYQYIDEAAEVVNSNGKIRSGIPYIDRIVFKNMMQLNPKDQKIIKCQYLGVYPFFKIMWNKFHNLVKKYNLINE